MKKISSFLSLFLALCVFCSLLIGCQNQLALNVTPEATNSSEMAPATKSLPKLTPALDMPEKVMLPEMAAYFEKNKDIIGWITIPDTVIDYPVMYSPTNPEKYLHMSFYEENRTAGEIFVDANCCPYPRSTNLILHGHNMKDGSMFSCLEDYKKEAFYKEHKTFQYKTLYELETYEIFACFTSQQKLKTDTSFKYYHFYHAENQAQFDDYVQNCLALSLYDTGIVPTYGDELIALSTCEYSQDRGRMVVVARKIV